MSIFDFARREFEKQYDSKLTITENKPIKQGAVTKDKWVDVLTDEPCRIAQKQLNAASGGDVSGISYITTLYCRPEIDVKAGSRISITDAHGVTRDYKRSSEGFSSYYTHQEVVIVREVKA